MGVNVQISNWMFSVFGGLATWIVVVACVLLALSMFFRVRLLHAQGEGVHWLLDRRLVIRFLCLLFFIWVLIGFNSNAPKLVLAPDYSAEQQAADHVLKKDTGGVQNLSPPRETAAETSERLEKIRAQQKSEVLKDEE